EQRPDFRAEIGFDAYALRRRRRLSGDAAADVRAGIAQVERKLRTDRHLGDEYAVDLQAGRTDRRERAARRVGHDVEDMRLTEQRTEADGIDRRLVFLEVEQSEHGADAVRIERELKLGAELLAV